MKRIIYKVILILLIILGLIFCTTNYKELSMISFENTSYAIDPAEHGVMDYNSQNNSSNSSGDSNVSNVLSTLLNGILGIVFWVLLLIPSFLVILAYSLSSLIVTGGKGWLTPDKIFFDKVSITRLDFLLPGRADTNSAFSSLVSTASTMFVVLFSISLILLFCVLLYISITAILNNVLNFSAEKRAETKEYFINWLTSIAMLFALIIIIVGTLLLNSIVVHMFTKAFTDTPIDNLVNDLMKNIVTPSLGLKQIAALILLIMLLKISWQFLFAYLSRIFKVMFLIFIAPLITITYSIDKIKDKKAQALEYWSKEFFQTVLTQMVHILLFLVISPIISTASGMTSIVGTILSIAALRFIFQGEQIIKDMFGIKSATNISQGAKLMQALGVAFIAKKSLGFLKGRAAKAVNKSNLSAKFKNRFNKGIEIASNTKKEFSESQSNQQGKESTNTDAGSENTGNNNQQNEAKGNYNDIKLNEGLEGGNDKKELMKSLIGNAMVGSVGVFGLASSLANPELSLANSLNSTIATTSLALGAKKKIKEKYKRVKAKRKAKKERKSINKEEQEKLKSNMERLEKITGKDFTSNSLDSIRNFQNWLSSISLDDIESEFDSARNDYINQLKDQGKDIVTARKEADEFINRVNSDDQTLDYSSMDNVQKQLAIKSINMGQAISVLDYNDNLASNFRKDTDYKSQVIYQVLNNNQGQEQGQGEDEGQN